MCLPLTHKGEKALELLLEVPPRLEEVEELLSRACLPPEEITKTGIRYLEECFYEVSDWAWQQGSSRPTGLVPGLHSTHVCAVLMLLLKFGLDPNAVYRNENVMDAARSIDNEYLAADALALLFEHGGDPNLEIGGESLFEDMDYDVWCGAVEQENRPLFDAWVHCWMVGLAYGGRLRGIQPQLRHRCGTDILFDPADLRRHREYSFCLTSPLDRDLRIFDKQTHWEVLRA